MNKLYFLFLFLFCSFQLLAQNEKQDSLKTGEDDLSFDPVNSEVEERIFDSEKSLDISLTYDITSFIKNKQKEEYTDAVYTAYYIDGTVTKEIKLKARGNFRKGHCFFPPIQLNFKNDPIKYFGLEGINKIKLVTHCSTSKINTIYILKEFLIYKLYNVISDKSFRVRLLNIDYIDTGDKNRNYEQKGFIIEPIKLLANRLNYTVINETAVRSVHVNQFDADVLAIFQYMIGNTDWRIKGGHNTKYIKSLTDFTELSIPVPYDFDFSGLVNASYSVPQEWSNAKDVRERDYLGYCRPEENYVKAIEYFLSKEEQIYATINNFSELPEKERKVVLNYIEDFFDDLKRRERFLGSIKSNCRNADF